MLGVELLGLRLAAQGAAMRWGLIGVGPWRLRSFPLDELGWLVLALRGSYALGGGGRGRRGRSSLGGGVRGRVRRRRLGMGVGVALALRGDTTPVGGRAPLTALLPHGPCFLLRWSAASRHRLIVVFAEAASSLCFADLVARLAHGILQLRAQLAVLEGAHLWRHDLCGKRRNHSNPQPVRVFKSDGTD